MPSPDSKTVLTVLQDVAEFAEKVGLKNDATAFKEFQTRFQKEKPTLKALWSPKRMAMLTVVLLALLTHAAFGQTNVYSLRVIGHTPFYERILLPKGNVLRPPTLRGVDDLKPAEHYPGTNRIDEIFADASRERTNGFYLSCLAEVPIASLSLRCPGDL